MTAIGHKRRAAIAHACVALALLAMPATALAERLPGIDVSRFQGRINWEQVGATGEVDYAFVQASRGSGSDCLVVPDRCGPDEFYDRNYSRARKEGIRVGPYHRTFTGGSGTQGVRADARKEAKVFLAEVGEDLRPGDLRPVLDVESPFSDLGEADVRRWVRTWLAKVEKETGVMPIIYTNVSSWNATGNTTKFAEQGYTLWVANFDVQRPLVPAENWGGFGWSIWQYTSTGSIDGIAGNVDRNWLRVPLDSISVGGSSPGAIPARG